MIHQIFHLKKNVQVPFMKHIIQLQVSLENLKIILRNRIQKKENRRKQKLPSD